MDYKYSKELYREFLAYPDSFLFICGECGKKNRIYTKRIEESLVYHKICKLYKDAIYDSTHKIDKRRRITWT